MFLKKDGTVKTLLESEIRYLKNGKDEELANLIGKYCTVTTYLRLLSGSIFFYKLFYIPAFICTRRTATLLDRLTTKRGEVKKMNNSRELIAYSRARLLQGRLTDALIAVEQIIFNFRAEKRYKALALALKSEIYLSYSKRNLWEQERIISWYENALELCKDMPEFEIRVLRSYASSLVRMNKVGASKKIKMAKEIAKGYKLKNELQMIERLEKRLQKKNIYR